MYRFDRAGWLESRGYLHRKLAFLDLNFWINLSEPQNNGHLELARLLSDLVTAGKLVCPISLSLLMELGKQPNSIRRDKRSRKMDELSQGLCIRTVQEILPHELRASLEGRTAGREMAYSHFLDAKLEIFKPQLEERPSESEGQQLLRVVLEKSMGDFLTNMTIVDFMGMWMGSASKTGAAQMQQNFSDRIQQGLDLRELQPTTRQGIEEAEFDGTLQSLMPVILPLLQDTAPELLGNLGNGLRSVLDSCPSFWCSYRTMSEMRLNKPSMAANDVWDFLHVAFATPYVDCLACDNSTRHICSNLLGMDQKYGTRIVSRGEDFLAWLQDLN